MPKEFDSCVRQVKAKIAAGKMPKGSNAYAVCTESFKEKHGKTPQQAAGETRSAVRKLRRGR